MYLTENCTSYAFGKTSSTPKPALRRKRIVRHALDAIDRRGLDALSMRSLAKRVGTRPMSLYRHISGKDDLLEAVASAMLDEIAPVAAGTPWQEGLRAWALGLRRVALRHPNAVPLLARRPMTSYDAGRDAAEGGLEMLERAGFDPDTAGLVLRSVARYVVGSSLSGSAPAPDADPAMLDALRAQGYRRLARMVERAGADNADELFAVGLESLVDGLALRLGARGSSVPGGPVKRPEMPSR